MMLLFLNDISGSEVLLILVFILIFFGSKSIPGIARTMGRTIRQIKDASSELQDEIRKSGAEMKKDLNLDGLIQDTAREIQAPLDQYASDIDNAIRFEPSRTTQIPKTPSDIRDEALVAGEAQQACNNEPAPMNKPESKDGSAEEEESPNKG